MALRLNVSRDHWLNEDPRTVTVGIKLASGTVQQITVEGASKGDVTRQELMLPEGLFDTSDATWEFPVAALPASLQPAEGTVVTDQETQEAWTAGIVTREVWGTIWRLLCKRQR
jgi:hypothetical protein